MAVRNFWVEANIDGRETLLGGGPRAKDGGMSVNIYQRDDGSILRAINITCFVDRNGLLRTTVRDTVNNEIVCETTTER